MTAVTESRAERKHPAGAAAALERLIVIQLGNRYLWLVAVLALAVAVQLSLLQYRIPPWFETVDLLAHSMVVFEMAMLVSALLLALAIPQTARAWREQGGGELRLSSVGLAATVVLVLVAIALMVPLMLLHRYPELAKEGVRFALTVLQRGMLLTLAAMITFNVFMILRLYFTLPPWLCALFAAVWHVLLGIWVTYLSTNREMFERLNDVYYYTHLRHYSDTLPNWAIVDERLGAVVYHNIEMPWYGYYLFAAILLWLLTFFMWLPRAGQPLRTGQ